MSDLRPGENAIDFYRAEVERLRTIFCHPTGPLLRYGDGVLIIEDANPEIKITWRMSRTEMLKIGFRFLIAAALAGSSA